MRSSFVTLALCLISSLSAQDRFKAGLWEYNTVGGDKPGPSMSCLSIGATAAVNGTPESVRANAEKSAAKFGMKITQYSFDGTTISMTMVSGPSIFTSKASYRGNNFENVITEHRMGKVTTKTITGKRVGPCP